MRVLALVTDAYGGPGGIAQANRDLFEAMIKLDPKNNLVIYPRNADLKKITGIPGGIIQQKPCRNRLLYSLNVLCSPVRRDYFNFIFCGHLYMAPLAQLLSWRLGIPYWIHIHGIEAWKKPRLSIVRAAEKAHLITSVSRYTRRMFLRWADINPQNVSILPNTVNQRFSPGEKSDALLTRYGLQGKKVLLTVGRISKSEKYKGHDRVISALGPIIEKHPDLVYVVAGDGDDRPRLEKLAQELNVSHAVRFIGHPSEEDLPGLYRSADVFVMPSTGEGFGIVFLEAAMCGLPVIGGSADGSMDALREGLIGRTIDPLKPAELRTALLSCLEAKTKNSTNLAALHFSKANFTQHVNKLISSRFFNLLS